MRRRDSCSRSVFWRYECNLRSAARLEEKDHRPGEKRLNQGIVSNYDSTFCAHTAAHTVLSVLSRHAQGADTWLGINPPKQPHTPQRPTEQVLPGTADELLVFAIGGAGGRTSGCYHFPGKVAGTDPPAGPAQDRRDTLLLPPPLAWLTGNKAPVQSKHC